MYKLLKTIWFERWYRAQTLKVRLQIDGRLLRIVDDGHFGHIRSLGGSLFELKFNNGNRVYYTVKEGVCFISTCWGK